MEPRPGRYKHYKGREYEVVGVARHSETLEELVVYAALYGNKDIWVRPRTMFLDCVDWEGHRQPRFRRVEEQVRPCKTINYRNCYW